MQKAHACAWAFYEFWWEVQVSNERKMTPRIGDFENCDVHEERAKSNSSSGTH
jgi:hypothetical protein